MSVLLQDTARNNLASWGVHALGGGYAIGAIVSPFTSPVRGNGYKQDARVVVKRLQRAGGEVWFDPTTHALQAPQVGDFRYYSGWDLWKGARGDLVTHQAMVDHVKKVFEIQTSLEVPLLAPTVLLNGAQNPQSLRAAELATVARREANARPVYLAVVGDVHFWSAGTQLDAHIGVLDQLEPAGWILTVARHASTLPAAALASEVEGLARTTYALSRDRPVIIGHGDLAGLPAMAAGATRIGTGWDSRQRVFAYTDHSARANVGSDGGGWYKRPTLEGLLGNMLPNELRVLARQDSALATRLTPGPVLDQPESAFRHHAEILTRISTELGGLPDRLRAERMRDRYRAAVADWPAAQAKSGCNGNARQWVAACLTGLEAFMASEGW
jgi:hypothetical protein